MPLLKLLWVYCREGLQSKLGADHSTIGQDVRYNKTLKRQLLRSHALPPTAGHLREQDSGKVWQDELKHLDTLVVGLLLVKPVSVGCFDLSVHLSAMRAFILDVHQVLRKPAALC